MATTSVVPGQSQGQPPTDPAVAALQLQQQQLTAQQGVLDARLKIQQDQQAMLTGMLPASTAAPQSGAFTVTGTNAFDSQKLAYNALTELAKKVAGKIPVTGPVLVYDQTEINSLVNYKAALRVLKAVQTEVVQLKGTFSNQMDPAAQTLLALPKAAAGAARSFAGILAPGLALGGLKTLSDLIGMFRTNTNIAFSSFTVDDAALTAAVVGALKDKQATVYEPAVMPLDPTQDTSEFMDLLPLLQTDLVNLQNAVAIDQSKVQQVSDAIGAFLQADQALQANTDQTRQAGLGSAKETARQFALALLGGTAADALDVPTANIWKAQRDQFLKELAPFVTSVSAMVTSFGTLQASLMAITSTGSATLTAILRAEKLMAKAKTANATVLLVKTSVLSGSVVTRTNLFTGGHLLYTGGAIVNYTLFDATGAVTASGLEVAETGVQERTF